MIVGSRFARCARRTSTEFYNAGRTMFSIESFGVEQFPISRAAVVAADPCCGGNRMKPLAPRYATMVAVK
jgi:hypothetical protein